MASQLFNGSSLMLQNDLLHRTVDDALHQIGDEPSPLSTLTSPIRRAFADLDGEAALLIIELDDFVLLEPTRQAHLLDHVLAITQASIRSSDIVEKMGPYSLAVALPGAGRIGMTRVADAIRQRVGAAVLDTGELLSTTVTIGAVHTTESQLRDPDDLLLAALVNLDSARDAGGNRTNWSDFQPS